LEGLALAVGIVRLWGVARCAGGGVAVGVVAPEEDGEEAYDAEACDAGADADAGLGACA
jgi:hypothetical protein